LPAVPGAATPAVAVGAQAGLPRGPPAHPAPRTAGRYLAVRDGPQAGEGGRPVNGRTRLAVVLAGVVFSVALNELNLARVRRENPDNAERNARSTMYGHTVWSPDNTYYVPPIKSLLAGRGYAIDPDNPLTRTRRVP